LPGCIAAVFAETDIFLTNELAAKLGVRAENSSLIKRADIAPRASLAYKTGKDAQVSLAYGIFYQKAENTQRRSKTLTRPFNSTLNGWRHTRIEAKQIWPLDGMIRAIEIIRKS